MSATLLGEKRSGSARIRTSRGILTYEEDWDYLVRTDSKYEDRNVVLGAPGLPVPMESIRGSMVCRTLSATRREEAPTYWDCTASFSSEVEENQKPADPNQPDNPIAWRVVRETKYETKTEIAYRDRGGLPIVNTALQPFETLPMFKRLIPVWDFWQFEPLVDVVINNFAYEGVTDEILADRNETYNQLWYKGREPYTLLLNVLDSSVGFYYGYRLRLTHYALKYDKKTWILKIPSVGTHELDAGVLTPIYVKGELTLRGLDADGGQVADDETPYIMEFDEYTPSDFSFLRI